MAHSFPCCMQSAKMEDGESGRRRCPARGSGAAVLLMTGLMIMIVWKIYLSSRACPALSAAVLFEGFCYQPQAGVEIDWFGDIGVHAGGETSGLVLFERMGRHGDDGDMAA